MRILSFCRAARACAPILPGCAPTAGKKRYNGTCAMAANCSVSAEDCRCWEKQYTIHSALRGEPGSSAGLQWLDLTTSLDAEKKLRRVSGVLALDQAPVTGYEIHHGVTQGPALKQPLVNLPERTDGAISDDGQIAGSYLHGLFDAPAACAALLRWAGLTEVMPFDYPALREQGIERLADAVEQHLDMRRIDALLQPAREKIHV